MFGVLIPPESSMPVQRVMFESPSDVFSKQACTIIGACVEKNLVFMGLKNDHHACTPNNSIPPALIKESVFEHTNGPILAIKTSETGIPIDIDVKDLIE
jgi:hypothetical protein